MSTHNIAFHEKVKKQNYLICTQTIISPRITKHHGHVNTLQEVYRSSERLRNVSEVKCSKLNNKFSTKLLNYMIQFNSLFP